jgi:glycosyltransferase involved in cell wall biosynthesis
MKPKAAVLIPTLNEEATMGQVIDRVPVRVLSDKGYGTAMYVIDGDSEDATNTQPLKRTRPC